MPAINYEGELETESFSITSLLFNGIKKSAGCEANLLKEITKILEATLKGIETEIGYNIPNTNFTLYTGAYHFVSQLGHSFSGPKLRAKARAYKLLNPETKV